jgi:DNA-binding response OmpR family regulator
MDSRDQNARGIRMDRGKSTILVVDDNQDIRDLITLILEDEGYPILVAAEGESALNIITIHNPDLVLLDVMMPGRSGIDVLEEIRSSHNSVPVVMITAKSQGVDIDRAIEAGATSYIIKPFRADVLLEKIQSLLPMEDKE